MKNISYRFMALISSVLVTMAHAQDSVLKHAETAFKANPPRTIQAPSDLNAISLSTDGAAKTEIWEEDSGGWRSVRNVTRPALLPVLPAPGSANGTAVIIAPGGGFLSLSIDSEGLKVARFLADRGITCFVLKYRVEHTPADIDGYWAAIASRFGSAKPQMTHGDISSPAVPLAQADGLAAIGWVRTHATQYGIDSHRIGFIGFSAGGMTAMNVATAYQPASRPDFIGVLYGGMADRKVPADAPPIYVMAAADDPLLGYAATPIFDAWRAAGRPAELHIYTNGGHGFGAKVQGKGSDRWLADFYYWLFAQGLANHP